MHTHMNTKNFFIITAVAAALQFAPSSLAQDNNDADRGKQGRHGGHARMLANLSGDERAKLRAAHQKVMADPAVQAAKDRKRQAAREFRELKRARLLQVDPSLQPILDKIPERGHRDK